MKKNLVTDYGRVCLKCNKYLPRECFTKNKSSRTWYVTWCKDCCKMMRLERISRETVVYEKSEDLKSYLPKYPAPNIDEIIGFVPIVKQEDLDY